MNWTAGTKLKSATIVALSSVSYIFVMRTVNTIVPALFTNLTTVQAITVISLIASLMILLFFIAFYTYYVQKDQVRLAGATLLSIIGRCGMILLHTKMLLRVFSIYLLTSFVYTNHFLDRFLPWVSSLFTLIFFYVFYRELAGSNRKQLRSSTILAAVGSCVVMLIQTFFVVQYFFARGVIPFVDIPRAIGVVFYVLLILNFCAMLFFFISFYRSIDMDSSKHTAGPDSLARVASP
jgi:hypothetical protein